MRTRLPNGDFLSLTVWAGKSDPTAEIITAQIRHSLGSQWETVGRIAGHTEPLMVTTHNYPNAMQMQSPFEKVTRRQEHTNLSYAGLLRLSHGLLYH